MTIVMRMMTIIMRMMSIVMGMMTIINRMMTIIMSTIDVDSCEDDDDVAAHSSLGLVVGSPSENSASKSPQILESGWNEAKRSQASIKYGMRPNTEIHHVWFTCTIHLIFDQ